jgi:hypothetical protein
MAVTIGSNREEERLELLMQICDGKGDHERTAHTR